MKEIILIFLFLVLVYTRFIGLNWGLPYPMHPDERNMATAIQSLNCRVQGSKFEVQGCYNPHFFAYGQFPLYVGYLLVQLYHFIVGKVGLPILFEEAAMSLRVISTLVSVINVIIIIKIIKTIRKLRKNDYFVFLPIVIFSPYFIQSSHFGTTEALLMLFCSLMVYYSLKLLTMKQFNNLTFLFLSLFSGLAIATKVSAAIFLILPIVLIISNVKTQMLKLHLKSKKQKKIILIRYSLFVIRYSFLFFLLTVFFAIFFSPHNLISFREFLGSMNYETAVALGEAKVFYTRQFEYTIPILFQMIKIFPYALGWPVFLLGVLGFFGLSWKDKKINFLRLAFLIYFLPNAFLYAKWTRFMAPILPMMSIFAILFLRVTVIPHLMRNLYNFFWIPAFAGMTIITILPGIAYLSIYQNPDVRFTTSEWIYKNIPADSYILFETANVVDVPIPSPNYQLPITNYQSISFNFYDVDSNWSLREEFYHYLTKADYIFVPSRRVFKNHYCDSNFQFSIFNFQKNFNFKILKQKNKCLYLKEKYPVLNNYYEKLFSGELGFEKVAEFSSYPRISLFGKTLIEFPDEEAEETWTVFDHPVIRIYAKQRQT